MTQPVFLVAARRSGTTLFRLMFQGHPDVVWHNRWEKVADAVTALKSAPGQTQTVKIPELSEVHSDSIPALRAGMEAEIDAILAESDRKLYGATVHVDIAKIMDAWPDAKFIHLVRDPRDIAISFLNLGWSRHPFKAVDGWESEERQWDAMKSVLNDDQYVELKYEDLVAAPEDELRRICAFLGLDYSDQLFGYVETSNYSMPKASLSYRWKKQITEDEVRQMESGRHEIMQSRGYAPAYENTHYSKLQQFQFKLVGEWKFRKSQIGKYGLVNLVFRKLGYALNIGALKTWADNSIEKRHKARIAMLEKNY